MRARLILLLLALSCCSGCGRHLPHDLDAALRPVAQPSPAPVGSAEANLAVSGGHIALSWMAPSQPGHAFQYAVRDRGAWSLPRTIAAGESLFANWADFPALLPLVDGKFAASWLCKHAGAKDAHDVRVAVSNDGVTWAAGSAPHRDGGACEHGFVSLVADPHDGCTAIWLDGRGYGGRPEGDPSVAMQLRTTDLRAGVLGDDVRLDDRVCDCCQTTAVRTARGLLVAYRDRSDEEIRDIALVRRESGSWSAPYPLAHDGWKIAGCPVNGPALAACGDTVAAAWFTMAGDSARVNVALSQDGGVSFSRPVRADAGAPLGHVAIACLPRGAALVVWIEAGAKAAATLRARRIDRDLRAHSDFEVAPTTADRTAGFPHVVVAGDTLWFAWTAPGDAPHVALAVLPVPASWR